MNSLKQIAKNLRLELLVIYNCFLDKRVKNYLKVLIFLIIAYALSPIDLIPDFIPVIGYLDDIIIIPLLISVVLRFIPHHIYEQHKNSLAVKEINPVFKKVGYVLVGLIYVITISLVILVFKYLF